MRALILSALAAIPLWSLAADCESDAPTFSPTSETFEETCTPGKVIVDLKKAKSPVVKLNFSRDQEVTISTHSGAKSPGGNGHDAKVCIWQSWDSSQPCGKSTTSQGGFKDWDGKATCSLKVPKGVQYVRALQVNSNADEQNTSITIVCRKSS